MNSIEQMVGGKEDLLKVIYYNSEAEQSLERSAG